MYLQELLDLVTQYKKKEPMLCVRDLVGNGVSLERFSADKQAAPCRHEVALFLAAWCRFAGFEPEMYRDWLINYSVDILSKISSSSASRIRHSTKSSITYIHRSNVDFTCNCESNIFHAHCSSTCSIYDEMKEIYLQNCIDEKKRLEEINKQSEIPEPDPESLPVYKRYEKRYLEAVEIIRKRLESKDTKKAISAILQEKGYKTRRGCEWSAASVSTVACAKGWSPKRVKKARGE